MNKSTITTQNSIQEKPKMKKYIVEVEEPKEGQVISTGGVRANGKMAAQFKNPIPYEVPKPTPTAIAIKSDTNAPVALKSAYGIKERAKAEAMDFALDFGIDMVKMVWYRWGKPILETKLSQAVDRYLPTVSQKKEISHSIHHYADKETEIIDVEAKDIITVNDSADDRIIPFSQKRAV